MLNIKNTNITPIKEVGEGKSFLQQGEQLVAKYESRLYDYGIYKKTWDGEKNIPNPKLKPILDTLNKVPLDRAERSILAFLRWIKDARNVEDKYKALKAAITNNWETR